MKDLWIFSVSIITECKLVDDNDLMQTHFVVEGHYKYKYNNGYIAMSDTHAASMNFVNALEKIPGIIAQYEERTAKLKADVPKLETIISKTWVKEDELKQFKSELSALDRKITAELAPKHDENDGIEYKQEQCQQSQPDVKVETVVNTINVHTTDPPQGHKPSIVAEPQPRYSMSTSMPRFLTRHLYI